MAEAAVAAAFAKKAAVFVGEQAAGAAISFFVKKALGRLTADDDEHLRQRLTDKLPVIQAIFGAGAAAGDDTKATEQSVGNWLFRFRDAMEEAEDALDELEFLDLEKEVKGRRVREARDWKEKVSSRLPDIRLGFRRSVSAVVTGGSSKRLKDALRCLDSVLSDAGSFLSIVGNRHNGFFSRDQDLGNTRETTRQLTTVVFGRQREQDEIHEWLGVNTAPGDRVDHTFLVCAIVGVGGMGKTTLAQSICQDKNVQDYFGGMIIWVNVSKRFDPKVLIGKILESINKKKAAVEALDSLQMDLINQLLQTRFLLVLDDAWEDTKDMKWEQFLEPLRKKAVMGGRVLLTTRMASVADAVEHQMRLAVKRVELTGLDHEDTLKLFNHHAFDASVPSDRLDLQLISEKIAEKLKGCPFVAKLVGQQLRDDTDRSRWNMVLNQEIHQFNEIGPRVMEMLRLSYQNLAYEVQRCFRYCSMFPPAFKFTMEELVEMWVGSGLIMQRGNAIQNLEDIAREHFKILARKSFFTLVPRELHIDPSKGYYVMHDLMHELGRSVSNEECSRFQYDDHSSDTCPVSPPKVHHLYIQSINSNIVRIISQSKKLRTLIIEIGEKSLEQEHMQDLKKALKSRTSLRLIKLAGPGWFGMNDAVMGLKHLRYIYMSVTDEPNLPKLFKLCHLQVLRIKKIDKEEKVRSIDIGNLSSLQKLDLPKSTLSRIPHIGRLTTLRELNGFSVRKKDGHKITELHDLRKLRKIIVLDVQNVSDCNEADAAKLDNKLDMKVPSLGWSDDQVRFYDQILQKLAPHRNLMYLTITRCTGIKPPMWIEAQRLSNLVHLKLDGCFEWIELPPLGSLRALKHIFLLHLQSLKYISSSYGSNAYSYKDNWAKGIAPGGLPACLVTFVVEDCPQLSELPDLPFSLQLLRINSVGMSSLPTMSDFKISEPQLHALHIESCQFLVSLNGCFLQEEHYKALNALKLFQCHALSSLPDTADFQRISKMEIVELIECNGLSALGGIGSLCYLKELKIEHCGNLITSLSSSLPTASAESCYLKLETLAIDNHQLLLLSPLRNLCLTRRLIISGTCKMKSLPEEWLFQNVSQLEHIEISHAEMLQSLPSKMQDLYTLRSLVLDNTHVLRSLPYMPPDLWVLSINGCCTELVEQYNSGGPECDKMNRIPNCCISKRLS